MIGLTYIMKLEGVSGKELSEKLGVSAAAVSQWEKKVRPIPRNRIPSLLLLFPAYPPHYFEKEIDEGDKIKLQEARLDHVKKNTLNDYMKNIVSDMDAEYRYDNIRNEELRLGTMVAQENLLNRISNLFAVSDDLEHSLMNITLHRYIIRMFDSLCNIEENILKNHIYRNTDNRTSTDEILKGIKQLAQDLEYQVTSFELAYKSEKDKDSNN